MGKFRSLGIGFFGTHKKLEEMLKKATAKGKATAETQLKILELVKCPYNKPYP